MTPCTTDSEKRRRTRGPIDGTRSDVWVSATLTSKKHVLAVRKKHLLTRRRKNQISEDLRSRIVELHEDGKGYKVLRKSLDIHLSTVGQTVCKWGRLSSLDTLPRSGAQRAHYRVLIELKGTAYQHDIIIPTVQFGGRGIVVWG